jgi:nicotinate-nucleotide adenylyltransferase
VREDVAIFGGSFNPPHLAHVLALAVVLSTHELSRIVVVPTFVHPFAKSLAPFEDRMIMCELAMGWLPRVSISRIEEALGGESRTLHTLEQLQAQHPGWAMRLVMGSDLLAESSKWFRFDKIRALAPPLVLRRAGFEVPQASGPTLPAISSTDVRALVGEAEWEKLAALVPRAVLGHIRERRLYARG